DHQYFTPLTNLGVALLYRCNRLGESNGLGRGISGHREVVQFIPESHSDKPHRMINLTNSFFIRFTHFGELSDLEQVFFGTWVMCGWCDGTSSGHPYKPTYLTNLANSFVVRYRYFGDLSDLERAISRLREAAQLTSDGHANKPTCLNNFAISFLVHFGHLGGADDSEQGIS
ncbi:hypothetical protein J3R83DRAFT_13267, partial [Lanmaoa asiatica]